MTAAGDAEAAFGRALAPLEGDPRVSGGTGFGSSPGRRVSGRIFAMLRDDALVVKLPADRVTAAVAAATGEPFDGGKGRPMREWLSVPLAQSAAWPGLVREAFEFVATAGAARPRHR